MLHQILEQSIRTSGRRGTTPGGVLAYGENGNNIETVAFGRSHTEPPDGVFDVTSQTIYDVASVTKPVATCATLMKLDVDPDEPVSGLFPELRGPGKDRITFAHLLGHASGFPAHLKFYERLLAGERMGASSPREALLRMVCATELDCPPGERVLYSDLGYITLGFAIERMTGKGLDVCHRELVTQPLEMNTTFFVDLHTGESREQSGPSASRLPDSTIAPTEVCPYRGLVHGEVHDDNCHAGGGIHGHAGLFSTVGDLERFAQAMVRAAAGLPKAHPGGFDPDVVARFVTRSAAPNTTWRLGWDRPSPPPVVSNAGTLWPRDGIGHMGFTGTCMWLDPKRGRYVILLTNRVHPSRDELPDQPGIRDLRRAVMDAVVGILDARDSA